MCFTTLYIASQYRAEAGDVYMQPSCKMILGPDFTNMVCTCLSDDVLLNRKRCGYLSRGKRPVDVCKFYGESATHTIVTLNRHSMVEITLMDEVVVSNLNIFSSLLPVSSCIASRKIAIQIEEQLDVPQ